MTLEEKLDRILNRLAIGCYQDRTRRGSAKSGLKLDRILNRLAIGCYQDRTRRGSAKSGLKLEASNAIKRLIEEEVLKAGLEKK